MNSPEKHKCFLQQIKTDYPVISFKKADKSRWSAATSTIYYDPDCDDLEHSVLHEIGHMLAEHHSYKTDIELLAIELEAWEKAKEIAPQYHITISQDHIEDCIDSYRAWLHKRSLCPRCHQTGLQDAKGVYSCPNCRERWQVSAERFCRPYRKKQRTL